jgi:hypothetical protein
VSRVDVRQGGEQIDRGLGRVLSIAVLVGLFCSIVAGATIWLLLTNPITVATAVETGEISPLIQQLATALYDALVSLLGYL